MAGRAAPLRPCLGTPTQPHCPNLTHTTRCPTHTRQHDQARGTAAERGYDAAWQQLSRITIERDNHQCQIRNPRTCITVATTADHVIPKARGGTDTLDNLQAACLPCNSGKRDR